MSKARRYGYLRVNFPSLEELLEENDETLFRSTLHKPRHVLCHLLPPPKKTGYNLRPFFVTDSPYLNYISNIYVKILHRHLSILSQV